MFAGKPIIGITGGIGSGKSFVARLFGELGCLVIDSDQQVRDAYQSERVKSELRSWWGDEVIGRSGEVDKRLIAAHVFADDAQRRRLEQLLHPIVKAERDALMTKHATSLEVVAFVWDTPLLFEAGLSGECDAIVYIDAPRNARLSRVMATRGWDDAELARRENLQWALDKKRAMSDHHVTNTADVGVVREQVRQTLSRILAGTSTSPYPRR